MGFSLLASCRYYFIAFLFPCFCWKISCKIILLFEYIPLCFSLSDLKFIFGHLQLYYDISMCSFIYIQLRVPGTCKINWFIYYFLSALENFLPSSLKCYSYSFSFSSPSLQLRICQIIWLHNTYSLFYFFIFFYLCFNLNIVCWLVFEFTNPVSCFVKSSVNILKWYILYFSMLECVLDFLYRFQLSVEITFSIIFHLFCFL